MALSYQDKLTQPMVAVHCEWVFTNFVWKCKDSCDVDLHRWQLSKTVKGDADDDIAKYDGL